MRKIILMMSVSLDGFMEGPHRELDWHLVDDELHSHFNEQLSAMGAFLDGRVTYELMAAFWPTADADPSSTGPMVEFARIWRDKPKIRVLPDPRAGRLEHHRGPSPRHRRGDGAQGTARRRPGGRRRRPRRGLHAPRPDRRVPALRPPGGPRRGQTPVPASEARIELQLAETRTFGNGVVLLRYERPHASDGNAADGQAR